MMAHWGAVQVTLFAIFLKKLKLLLFETGFSVICCNGWQGIGRVNWNLKNYEKPAKGTKNGHG